MTRLIIQLLLLLIFAYREAKLQYGSNQPTIQSNTRVGTQTQVSPVRGTLPNCPCDHVSKAAVRGFSRRLAKSKTAKTKYHWNRLLSIIHSVALCLGLSKPAPAQTHLAKTTQNPETPSPISDPGGNPTDPNGDDPPPPGSGG